MPIITDFFDRPNQSPIGAPWTYFNNGGTNPAGLQLLSHGFAPSGPSTTPQNGIAVYLSGGAFADDQFAQATIQSIAPPLATLTISAAVQAAGNTTYTYILTSGTPVFSGMDIVVAGMQNAGNDGDFIVTSILGSTFTVANASGVTESGSVGTGTANSDSLCGLMVRATADGMNGYFTLIGTNSAEAAGSPGTGRAYAVELWRILNGTFQFITAVTPTLTSVPDRPGDIYSLTAGGSTIVLRKNGSTLLVHADDGTQLGGYPGIFAGSLSNATPKVGNSGTIWTDWIGSDSIPAPSSGWIAKASDSFSGSGNLNNPPWQQTSYSGSVVPTVNVSGSCTTSNEADNATAEYTGRTWANDQASELTVLDMPAGEYFECTVRNNAPGSPSLNNYILIVISATGIGTSGTWTIYKTIAGSLTSLATGTVSLISIGDVLSLRVRGSTLTGLQNGSVLGTASDSAIAVGSPGFLIGTAHISKWTGYEFVSSSNNPGGSLGNTIGNSGTDGLNPSRIISSRTSMIGTNFGTRIIGR